jgi:hypothetical protein
MASAAKGEPMALVEIVGKAMDHYSDKLVSVLGPQLGPRAGRREQGVNENTNKAVLDSMVDAVKSTASATTKAALEKIQKATPPAAPQASARVPPPALDVQGIKNAVAGALPSLENIEGVVKTLVLSNEEVATKLAEKDKELTAKDATIKTLQDALHEAQMGVQKQEVQLTRAKALNTSLFQHVIMLCGGDENKFTQVFYGFMFLVNNGSMDKSELKNILNAALFISAETKTKLEEALGRDQN